MNYDKIDTLLMAAGCRFEFLHDKDYEDFSPYKFAQLIVKECAGVAEVSMPIGSHPDDRLTVKNSVLEHFGVEE